MIPIYARDILGVGSTGFAIMVAALGAGFIVGSLLGALGSIPRRGFVIFGLIVIWGAGMVIFSQTDWYALTIGRIFLMGVAGALTDNLITVSIQQLTEDRMHSRVSGLHRFVNYIDPMGAMLGGFVAALVSIEFALIVAAIASTALTVTVALASPSVRRL
jgi:predicted MFS family arabinose efflux permease